jgi:hypothetical protein
LCLNNMSINTHFIKEGGPYESKRHLEEAPGSA